MIIHLKDTAIQLNPSEVRAAKKLISRFITSVSSASKRTGQISFYFTVLIIMHIMSQQLLETFDPKDLQEIMKKYQKIMPYDFLRQKHVLMDSYSREKAP